MTRTTTSLVLCLFVLAAALFGQQVGAISFAPAGPYPVAVRGACADFPLWRVSGNFSINSATPTVIPLDYGPMLPSGELDPAYEWVITHFETTRDIRVHPTDSGTNTIWSFGANSGLLRMEQSGFAGLTLGDIAPGAQLRLTQANVGGNASTNLQIRGYARLR